MEVRAKDLVNAGLIVLSIYGAIVIISDYGRLRYYEGQQSIARRVQVSLNQIRKDISNLHGREGAE